MFPSVIRQDVDLAAACARETTGIKIPTSNPIMPITTSSSTSVNAEPRVCGIVRAEPDIIHFFENRQWYSELPIRFCHALAPFKIQNHKSGNHWGCPR